MLVAAELDAAGSSVPPNSHDTEAAVAMIDGDLDAREIRSPE